MFDADEEVVAPRKGAATDRKCQLRMARGDKVGVMDSTLHIYNTGYDVVWHHGQPVSFLTYLDLVTILDGRLGLFHHNVERTGILLPGPLRIGAADARLARGCVRRVVCPGSPLKILLDVKYDLRLHFPCGRAGAIWGECIVAVAAPFDVAHFDFLREERILSDTKGMPRIHAPMDKRHIFGMEVQATVFHISTSGVRPRGVTHQGREAIDTGALVECRNV